MKHASQMKFDYKKAAKLIDEQGRRPRWVAEKIGIGPGWLRSILVGRATPSLAVVRGIASTLGVSEEELLIDEAA